MKFTAIKLQPHRSTDPVSRITPKFVGRRYPEQSSRQALRGHRRAQGGPGIVLVNGRYESIPIF